MLAAAIFVALVAAGSWFLLRPAKPATLDDALRRFRATEGTPTAMSAIGGPASPAIPAGQGPSTPSSSASPGAHATAGTPSPAPAAGTSPEAAFTTPEHGVYVYDTTGFETTDALTGGRHDYPAQTTITVQDAGCGSVQRWQPLDQRWDETESCKVDGGYAMRRFEMYHEFFSQGSRELLVCDPDAITRPRSPRSGQSWTFHCHSSRTSVTATASVVGFESLTVGGRTVPTVHLRFDSTGVGADRGTRKLERWIDQATGLIVRSIGRVDGESDMAGGTYHYHEESRLDLTSTTPRR
jgi:hypothetical protein